MTPTSGLDPLAGGCTVALSISEMGWSGGGVTSSLHTPMKLTMLGWRQPFRMAHSRRNASSDLASFSLLSFLTATGQCR